MGDTPWQMKLIEDFTFTTRLYLAMMMMSWFCGMVHQREALSLISSWENCQRSSPSQTSNTPEAGFQPAQSLSSGFVELSCAVVINTTPTTAGYQCFLSLYISSINMKITKLSGINDTHMEELVLYWTNSLKCKVGCFWY